MNFTIDEELNKLKEEFDKRFSKLEKKYKSVLFYKIVPTILDKVNCNYLELDFNEINKNTSEYIVDYDYKAQKIIVQRTNIKSND